MYYNIINRNTLFKGVFFDIINDDEPQFCQIKYQFKFPYSFIKPDLQNNNYSLYLENINNIGNIYINLITEKVIIVKKG